MKLLRLVFLLLQGSATMSVSLKHSIPCKFCSFASTPEIQTFLGHWRHTAVLLLTERDNTAWWTPGGGMTVKCAVMQHREFMSWALNSAKEHQNMPGNQHPSTLKPDRSHTAGVIPVGGKQSFNRWILNIKKEPTLQLSWIFLSDTSVQDKQWRKDTHPHVSIDRHEYFIKNKVSSLVEEGKVYFLQKKNGGALPYLIWNRLLAQKINTNLNYLMQKLMESQQVVKNTQVTLPHFARDKL